MSKDIAVFINVRKESRRCKNKMLKSFAGTTLIDILLSKLENIKDYKIHFAAYEDVFINKAKLNSNINIIKRSKESAYAHSDPEKVFEALNSIPSEYVAWINPSHPLLEIDTFLKAIEYFKGSKSESLTSVKQKKAWLYYENGEPITNKSKLEVDTVLSEKVLEVAHSFHIYSREYMLKNGQPWKNVKGDPYLYEIPEAEAYDIDTEEEFIMVEALYRHYRTAGEKV